MNNRGGSIGELISNSFKKGEMHSSDQNTKSIEEALCNAIHDFNYKEVESLVEQVKQKGSDVRRIIYRAVGEADDKEVRKKNKEAQGKIEKIREFLSKEFIAAPPVDASVKSIGATASGQEIPMVENLSSLSPQSSVSGDECSSVPSSSTKLPKSDEGDTDNNNDKYVKVSSEDITKEDLTPKGSGSLQGIQSEISVPSPSAFPNGNGAPTIEEHMVIMADIEDSSGRLVGEGDVSSITGDLHGISIEDDMSSLGTANDEYGEDSSGEDVTDESEKTNKGDSTLKSSNSTKSSRLPIVAASALAVTGVATGIAIAVYLEMLAVGVAVGVCCLVAAVIIYCCNRPSNSLECNNVRPVADRKLVG